MNGPPAQGVRRDVDERKRALRERMRAARAALSLEERMTLADAVEERLFSLPELARAGSVLLFYSFGTEVPTSGLIRRLLAEERRVLLPFLDPAGAMEAAELRPGDQPERTSYGPKEPPRRVAVDPSEVGVAVTPGLAFDRVGRRLGYGGGHYDRYLGRLGAEAARVGVAFSLQIVEEVPALPADELVDVVVTNAEVIRPAAARER